ncbi:MAG: phytoene/squalene synthase family protein [Gemmatimonadetes bacterium]|nr:phytoene/squalene synthase family protein [Gemmatimonadota bacterium]
MPIADAQQCERLTRRHARTFAVASYLLPAEKRRGTFALYAFCRVADDIVDSQAGLADRGAAGAALQRMRADLDAALAGHGHNAVFRELSWTIRTFGVPGAPLHELLNGVATDLTHTRWDTFEELRTYSEGVAGCVGEMCASVMGIQGARDAAVRRARDLGVAMQLTNILRDVGEDAARGRVYLPADELAQHGFSADDVLDGSALHRPGWRVFMRGQVARAREWYARAMPGIHHLAPDAQRCAWACAVGYARILDVIERNGYDSFTRRASLGWGERALVLGKCLLSTPHTHAA